MQIRELFKSDVTRNIAPVIYFHEQSPAKLAEEVAEYIITGGYPPSDPRASRAKDGIHEEAVRLLTNVANAIASHAGAENPAAWISGFFGSGKSSFAKLIGLALDGRTLPDGRSLADAWLARNDSTQRQELVDAWRALTALGPSLSIVFDIGTVARSDEHIHSAVVRQLQKRLGYCANSSDVADFELKLERDGQYAAFLQAAQRTLGKPWPQAMLDARAEDHFSHVMSVLDPERYRDPMAWIDSRAGSRSAVTMSAEDAVGHIVNMLAQRAPGQRLFIVVDEVSQYVHSSVERMLRLQSFVEDLGTKLKGGAWLFATGQQKLDDGGSAELAKLKDRFPERLRVHLGTANIRDVLHKRLLQKKPSQEEPLRTLIEAHRSELANYAYAASAATIDDLVQVYPMLPGHIDLLLRITTELRAQSHRVQGDDQAIRGLLQLLGELFRGQRGASAAESLADKPVGHLVTLDAIFEVIHTALPPDVQTTLTRIFDDAELKSSPLRQMAYRVTKAVALLGILANATEPKPATAELIAQCLYDKLGAGNLQPAATEALDYLRGRGLVSYSEKEGYKIQSSAGQEWQTERDRKSPASEKTSELIGNYVTDVVVDEKSRGPTWRNRNFPWALYFSDGAHANDRALRVAREQSAFSVDFRILRRGDKDSGNWVTASGQDPLRNRLLWIAGDASLIESTAKDLGKSQLMIAQYEGRVASLDRNKQGLLYGEQSHAEELAARLRNEIATGLLDGTVYFRGQAIRPRDFGDNLRTVLEALATRFLPELYPLFIETAVTQSDFDMLFAKELNGPSPKLFTPGLGILKNDDGKYLFACDGKVPQDVLATIREEGTLTGQTLIAKFVGPPFGYPADVTRAVLLGLLRGKFVTVRTDTDDTLTSYVDVGAKDVFGSDRAFRRAEFSLNVDEQTGGRDRIENRKMLETWFAAKPENEDEAICDAAFAKFPEARKQLQEVERAVRELSALPALTNVGLPSTLTKFASALEDCLRDRKVAKVMSKLTQHRRHLIDGAQQLKLMQADLSAGNVAVIKAAALAATAELAQLAELGAIAEPIAAEALRDLLGQAKPWTDAHNAETATASIKANYKAVRQQLLASQGEQIDTAKDRLRLRADFAKLPASAVSRVFAEFDVAQWTTTATAVAPTLAHLRDGFAARLRDAEDQANATFDREVSQISATQVVKVKAQVAGREVSSRAELRSLFNELEERIGPELDAGRRVRIV